MLASPASPAPVVLMVSPTGARRTKADHPALPMTPDEIARSAAACAAGGAAMIHLHVRDRDGRHTIDPDAYRAALAAIERECGADGIAVQVTSESAGRFGPREQEAAVRALRPRAVSIAVREAVPAHDLDAESAAAEWARWMAGEEIAVQWIVYAPNELERFLDLRRRGILADGPRTTLMLVLGRYVDAVGGEPRGLLPFLAALPGDVALPWMICAFGGRENACVLTAAALGGHGRVGFENNLQLPNGTIAAGPEALVAQAAASLSGIGLRPASVAEARARFGG